MGNEIDAAPIDDTPAVDDSIDDGWGGVSAEKIGVDRGDGWGGLALAGPEAPQAAAAQVLQAAAGPQVAAEQRAIAEPEGGVRRQNRMLLRLVCTDPGDA
jgi:hypothetical protein